MIYHFVFATTWDKETPHFKHAFTFDFRLLFIEIVAYEFINLENHLNITD